MPRIVFRSPLAILSLLCALSIPCTASCAQTNPPAKASSANAGAVKAGAAQDSSKIKEGDLVSVNFTAMTEKGELVRTTYEKTAQDPGLQKSAYFETGAVFGPEDVIAGRSGSIPGLSEAVIGMTAGEKKKVSLQPDNASGSIDPAKRKEVPCVKNMPKTIRLSPQEYVRDFRTFPVVGKEVPITPYFKAAVVEVSEQFAVLECQVKDGERFEEGFGTVDIKVDQQNVSIILTPRLGSNFPMSDGKSWKIASTTGTTFTVDANNPLAGIPLTVDIEIASVTKAVQLDSLQIQWVDDYEKGIALAREQKKPTVLVLYAAWCGFSKKLLNETLKDPRVKTFKDRFVWIKIDSDAQKKYGELYAQKGFPLILILDPEGHPMDRMDGFRDAAALHDELVKTSKTL